MVGSTTKSVAMSPNAATSAKITSVVLVIAVMVASLAAVLLAQG
jgi:hypothetical protein